MRPPKPLSAWLWLGLPLAALAMQIVAKAVGESFYRTWMRGELGIVENMTVLFLLVAVVTALRLHRLRQLVSARLFGPFVLLLGAGCFFFAGEEASWGQHWFGFAPPESVALRNDQGEFNLHNDPFFEKLLDQLPRNILSLAALIGGVIAPLVRRRRAGESIDFDTPGPWGWIWPTAVCLPAAVLALTVTVPKKIFEALERDVPYLIDISPGETKEYCLGLFLMLYVVTLHRALRLRAAPAASPG